MTLLRVALLAAAASLLATGNAMAQYCQNCPQPGCNDCREGTCTADGVCYPKRSTWGYYTQRWTRWPGDKDDALPEGSAAAVEQDLPPINVEIPPEIEDLQAPPPSDAEATDEAGEAPAGEEGSGAADINLPPLPPIQPLSPPRPGGDTPPPLPGFPTPPPTPGAAGPVGGFSQQRPALPSESRQPTPVRPRRWAPLAQDAPPALPPALRAPRAATQRAIYSPMGPAVVQPAAAHRLPPVR